MPVSQIVFYSHNLVNITGGSMREMVRDILASCSRYDRTSGITGALAFNENFFLQAMEGEAVAISEQLWKIASDNRHNGMVLLSARTVDERDFQGWMVGYAGQSESLADLYIRYGTKPKLNPTEMPIQSVIGLLRAFSDLDGSHFIQRSKPGGGLAPPPKVRAAES